MAKEKIGTAVLELTTESGAFFKDLDEVEKRAGRIDKSWRETGKSLQAFGKQTSDVGAALTKMSLPLLALGVGAAKAAIDFESSFAGVRKTVDATEGEFSELSAGFRELAKTIPVNVNELNRLGEAAGALGIPKEEIVDFARVMAMLGVTTNVTSEQAAESIAKIQNIFGAAGKDTERFASTLVALGNDGASTEHQILELANRIASAGNAVGLSQGQVLGFAAAIANVGIEAEAGGTAISKVFLDISKAVSHGGAELAGFAKVAGMSSEKYAQAFRVDAANATRLFIEGLGRIKDAGGDLNVTIEQLGFTEVRQSNLLRSLALSGDNLTKSLDLQAKAWTENTALQKEAGERFKTLASQGQLLWNRLQDIAISLGNALVPTIQLAIRALGSIMPVLEGMVKTFASLPAPIQATAIALAGLLVAAGPVVFVAGQIITQLGVVSSAMFTLGNSVPVLTARLWLMEAAGGSLGVSFGGVGAIAGTLGRLLTGSVGLAFIGLDVTIRALTDNSTSLIPILRDMATVMGDKLLRAAETVWGVLKAWAATMGSFLSETAKDFVRWLRDSVPLLNTFIQAHIDALKYMGLVTKEGAAFWSINAQLVRDGREVTKWLADTSKKLEEQSQKHRQAATTTDLLAGANEVLAREYAAAEARAKGHAAATQQSEEQMKAAKKAADDFKASLKALGGNDALDGAREVVKQLAAMGGPLNVLPSKLDEMASRLRAGAEAAMTMKDVKLANEFTLLAKTLDPVVQFQQRYNVTIGDFVTTNPSFVDAIMDQATALEKPVDVIQFGVLPNLMDLKKLWVQFAATVYENDPFEKAVAGIKELGTTLQSLSSGFSELANVSGGRLNEVAKWLGTVTSASNLATKAGEGLRQGYETLASGGIKNVIAGFAQMAAGAAAAAASIMQATNTTSRAKNVMGGLVSGAAAGAVFGPWGAAVGAVAGALIGMFRKTNQEVARANAEIDKLRNGLLDTHGPLDQLERKANLVGLSFVENWGHRGQGGLKAMNALIAEFERRTKAVAEAVDRAVAGFGAVAAAMTKPWIEVGQRVTTTREELDKATEALARFNDTDDSEAHTEALRVYDEALAANRQALDVQAATAETSRQKLADLGTQAVATFAAAMLSGDSYAVAMAKLAPMMTPLAEAYEALGLEVEDVALQHLLLQSTVATANPELITAISGLGESTQALAQMGLLNVDTFGAMQRTGLELYSRLQAAVAANGGETRDALLPMQGYLQDAAIQAELLGIPLDENTQRLIDQSQELGIWRERGKTAQDLLIEGMQALVVKVGELLDQLLGVTGAINTIPTHRTFTVEATYFDPGAPDGFGDPRREGAISMAEGGMGRVTKPTLFLAGDKPGGEDFAFSGTGRRFGSAPGTAPDSAIGVVRDELRVLKNAFAHQTELMVNGVRDALAQYGSV